MPGFLWQYRLWSVKSGDTKLERFLQNKIKYITLVIKSFKNNDVMMLSKNVNNKKCAQKLILFNEKNEKDSDDF